VFDFDGLAFGLEFVVKGLRRTLHPLWGEEYDVEIVFVGGPVGPS